MAMIRDPKASEPVWYLQRERESNGKFDCSITSPTRYDLGSSPEPGVTCGFSLLFVLVLDPRVFSLPYPIRHGNSGGQRAIT